MTETTPQSFYEMFVVPNFDDYLKEPDNIRLASMRASRRFQLADILYAFYRRRRASKIAQWPKPKDLKKELCRREPCFSLCRALPRFTSTFEATAAFTTLDRRIPIQSL
jgi:hypothetical protein